jgi:hypothetical protein
MPATEYRRRPVAPADRPRHTRGMDQNEYDEYVRRWRRKFTASLVVGLVLGLILMGYLLYGNR